MDEKTEELRDIFVDVAGEDTVTERQEAGHGSLLSDEDGVEERLLAVIDGLGDGRVVVTLVVPANDGHERVVG